MTTPLDHATQSEIRLATLLHVWRAERDAWLIPTGYSSEAELTDSFKRSDKFYEALTSLTREVGGSLSMVFHVANYLYDPKATR